MGSNSKNTLIPETKVTTSLVGEKGHRQRFSRKLIALLVAILVVTLGGFLVLLNGGLHIGQKVYAQSAGHKIYKKDVQKIIGNNKNISDHQAATVLADKYLVEAMAKEQGVTVTQEDIEYMYGPSITEQKINNSYAYQNKVNQLYFTKLAAYNTGLYKGQLLVTNFSRNIPYQSPLLEQKKAANPNIGNPAAIAADKKYAEDLINTLYQQVKEGKITFEQAAQIEQNDPAVGEKAYPTLPHSGAFDTLSKSRRNGLIQTDSIRQKINDIKPGQTSKPFVVSVANSINDDSMAESYFLVVKIDSSAGGNSGMSFEQEIAQAKQKLDYKVYV